MRLKAICCGLVLSVMSIPWVYAEVPKNAIGKWQVLPEQTAKMTIITYNLRSAKDKKIDIKSKKGKDLFAKIGDEIRGGALEIKKEEILFLKSKSKKTNHYKISGVEQDKNGGFYLNIVVDNNKQSKVYVTFLKDGNLMAAGLVRGFALVYKKTK